MSFRRTLIGVAGVLLLTAGGGLVLQPPAQADNVCNVGEYCIWSGINKTGDFWDPSGNDSNWPCGVLCSPDVDNNDDSVWNRETAQGYTYNGTGYTGGVVYCVRAGLYENDINGARDNIGDSHSIDASLYTCSGYPTP